MATLTVMSSGVDFAPQAKTDGLSPLHDEAVDIVIRQNPFSLTLDSWAMLVASVMLVAGMHFLQTTLLEAVIVMLPVVLLVRNDYVNFLLLGPGGTPPTFNGYLRLVWLRLFSLRDVYHYPATPDSSLSPAAGILQKLPYRPGPRPRVAGLAPQRQLNQQASTRCYAALRAAVVELAQGRPQMLCTETSAVEKHGFGLFARHPVNAWGQGEIFHIHDTEKSMHMCLHPDDIKEVLVKGWGQRHPLAFTGWIKSPVPKEFVMIYAPRDEVDLENIARIIEAAIWYTTAESVHLKLPALSSVASL